jgi:hypothetical protein
VLAGPAALLLAAIVSLPTAGAPTPPEVARLEELPGIALGPYTSVGQERRGLEWSSVASFGGELLLLDDRTGPVVPGPDSEPFYVREGDTARGLVLFRVLVGGGPVRLERAWPGAFRAALAQGRFANPEGMAARGAFLYLIGSHSHQRDGDFDPQRQEMLRLALSPEPRVLLRRVRLREALGPVAEEIPELAASRTRARVAPEAVPQQLDIEGLSVLPGSDDLLLGLRAPTASAPGVADGRCREAAVVLRLHEVDAIFDVGAAPRLSPYAFLCFGDRGIAALDFDPASGSYLVAASRPPGGRGHTSLWQWDPRPCARAPLRELLRFSQLRLEGVARIEAGPYAGKLALAFDSHYFAGALRPQNTNEGSFVVLDLEVEDQCSGD